MLPFHIVYQAGHAGFVFKSCITQLLLCNTVFFPQKTEYRPLLRTDFQPVLTEVTVPVSYTHLDVYKRQKYTRASKPVNEADVEKMMSILNRMREEDPTWVIEQSKELKQTLVHGQGEFHIHWEVLATLKDGY